MTALSLGDPAVSAALRNTWVERQEIAAPSISSRARADTDPWISQGSQRYRIETGGIAIEEGDQHRFHPIPAPDRAEFARWFARTDLEERGYSLSELLQQSQGAGPVLRLGPHGQWKQKLYVALLGGFYEGEGVFGGMAIFDLGSEKWQRVHPRALLDVAVTDVQADPVAGAIWVSTASFGEWGPGPGSGLLRFDPVEQRWDRFTSENSGLPSDLVWWIRVRFNGIWIGTDAGLSFRDRASGRFTHFRWKAASPDSPVPFALDASELLEHGRLFGPPPACAFRQLIGSGAPECDCATPGAAWSSGFTEMTTFGSHSVKPACHCQDQDCLFAPGLTSSHPR